MKKIKSTKRRVGRRERVGKYASAERDLSLSELNGNLYRYASGKDKELFTKKGFAS